jgi:hypothetical protein
VKKYEGGRKGWAQCLGSTRLENLQNWRISDGMDFASCVGGRTLIPTHHQGYTHITFSSIYQFIQFAANIQCMSCIRESCTPRIRYSLIQYGGGSDNF